MASAPAARRAMGRGLGAILPDPDPDPEEQYLREVELELIRPNPSQPRSRFDPEKLDALATSIASEGVIQPLVLQPLADGGFEIVAGERRWRAAQRAGLERVPALVRDAEEGERLRTALVENMVREDLSAVEEARACATLVEDLGMSKQAVARSLGRSRAAISNLIRILELPDAALELLDSGALSEGHGRAILTVHDSDARARLARTAADRSLSVREVERRAKALNAADGTGSAAGRGRISADERAALDRASEALSMALGRDARVRKSSDGYLAEIQLDSIADGERFAERLAVGPLD